MHSFLLGVSTVLYLCQAVDRLVATQTKKRKLFSASHDVERDVAVKRVHGVVLPHLAEKQPGEITSSRAAHALSLLRAKLSTDFERNLWLETARTEAILGSCPKSLPSVASGIRAWLAFAADILGLRGREFPPTVQGLLAWSSVFCSEHTFANYLGYARVGCALANQPTHAFDLE